MSKKAEKITCSIMSNILISCIQSNLFLNSTCYLDPQSLDIVYSIFVDNWSRILHYEWSLPFSFRMTSKLDYIKLCPIRIKDKKNLATKKRVNCNFYESEMYFNVSE